MSAMLCVVPLTDVPERSRFELHEGGELVGWLDYRPAGPSVILAHTEVAPEQEGHGYGGVLVRGAFDAIGARGKTVIPLCPFAAAYVDRHPELQDRLAPHVRVRRR